MVVDGVLLAGVLGPQDETMRASRVKGATQVLVCRQPSGRSLEGLLCSEGRPRQMSPPWLFYFH
jgi:hypothetical protein